MNENQAVCLLVCALGGEGGGVLTEWLVETARAAGYPVQATSIPGVAQRTGATTYYIEVFPVPLAQLGGRRPVFSLNPVPGALDAIVSSELLETARQVGNGMSSQRRTCVITSSSRVLTTLERMQLADGRADSQALLDLVGQFSRKTHVFDMAAAAKEAGTIVSAVMLGAIAGSGVFPFARERFEEVVKGSGASAAASLRGFARGFAAVSGGALPGGTKSLDAGSRIEPAMTAKGPKMDAESPAVAAAWPAAGTEPPAMTARWPASVREMATLGHQRLVDYQGTSYAELYANRLQVVIDTEAAQAVIPASTGDPTLPASMPLEFATSREAARWLALWMAFDDIVRVADLKSRASRWERVKRETRAADDELLKVYDHFKPGAPEFAALLPQALADRVLAWDRSRKSPWSMPLKIGSHGVMGMLSLRLLASLKWLRPHGSRFATEQRMIEAWLRGIVEGTQRHWRLGHEIALCGRLIKGYGATNERGKENLLHVLHHLAQGDDAEAAATAIAAAREAALADDMGKALDATLVKHGAPAREIKPQPIRWMRKPT